MTESILANSTIEDLREIWHESSSVARRTPVFSSSSLSESCGGDIALKAESLQRTGSFKLRGALAKVRTIDPVGCTGVVAGSAGNHAQSLAYAARWRGLGCRVFMPREASISKVAAVRAFGATVDLDGSSVDECVDLARRAAEDEGLVFVHPFDDATIVRGQAGLGLELSDQIPDLRLVLVPVGGGGLAAGVAMAIKQLKPSVRIVGVQSESWPAAAKSVTEGHSTTILGGPTLADGIAIKRPGGLTLALLERWLDDIVTVDDESVAEAMVYLLERSKLVVEGAGAVTVGAIRNGAVSPALSGRTVAILSGGNVDAHVLTRVIGHHETSSGRRIRFFTSVADRPGGLVALLATISEAGGNVLDVSHVRDGVDIGVGETGVEVSIATRGRNHANALREAIVNAGYVINSVDPAVRED